MGRDEWADAREVRSQIEGVCFGIIFCSWFLGAESVDVALIRLPATLILSFCLVTRFVFWLKQF